jgi:hypothetical protein
VGVCSVNIGGFVDLLCLNFIFRFTTSDLQTCIKRSSLSHRNKWSFTIVALLREVQLILNFLTGQDKCELLLEVTA